jgi:hypothetical protein
MEERQPGDDLQDQGQGGDPGDGDEDGRERPDRPRPETYPEPPRSETDRIST